MRQTAHSADSENEMAEARRAEIPVLDLAAAPQPAERLRLLRSACEGPGCFRVVNHNIPSRLQSAMKSAVRSLLDLPSDLKHRANGDVISGSGYVPPTASNPLYEALGLYDAASPADVLAFCDAFDAPDDATETIASYASKIHELAVELALMVGESLGLSGGDCSFDDWPCQFRMNKYEFKEETVGSCGVQCHTDSGFLTILQEDESVGGLEVMDGAGEFLAVDPVPRSFLVNLGDVAKAWSNGSLHNVKHRVMCKKAEVRVSIAFFMHAPKDDVVEPPSAFIRLDRPRLYQTFTYDDYRKLRLSSGSRAGEALSLLATSQSPTLA